MAISIVTTILSAINPREVLCRDKHELFTVKVLICFIQSCTNLRALNAMIPVVSQTWSIYYYEPIPHLINVYLCKSFNKNVTVLL